MAITTTNRMQNFTGTGGSMTITVNFTAEADDIRVYKNVGEIDTLIPRVVGDAGEDPPFTTNWTTSNTGYVAGLSGAETFTLVMTTTVLDATYTVVRTVPRVQPESITTAHEPVLPDRGLTRLAAQYQDSLFATYEVYNAAQQRIQLLAAPIKDEDMATQLYLQAKMSRSMPEPTALEDQQKHLGQIPPVLDGIDSTPNQYGPKFLYAYDEHSVAWKHANQLGFGTSGKIAQVADWNGMRWVTAPTLAPDSTVGIPAHLSLDNDGDAIQWRVISDLPDTTDIDTNWGITAQATGSESASSGCTVAWERIEDIPPPPEAVTVGKKYILTVWANDGIATAKSSHVATSVNMLDSDNPTTTYASDTTFDLQPTDRKHAVMTFDLTGMTADWDTVTTAVLKLRKLDSDAGSDVVTMQIGKLASSYATPGELPYDPATVSWNYSEGNGGSTPWNGGTAEQGGVGQVDFDKHIYPLQMGDLTPYPKDDYYTYDIYYLVKDAIENNNGILHLCIFCRSEGSNDATSRFASENHGTTAYRPKVEISTATSRSVEWLRVLWGRMAQDYAYNQRMNYQYCAIADPGEDPDPGTYLYADNQTHAHGYTQHFITHNFGIDPSHIFGVVSLGQSVETHSSSHTRFHNIALDINHPNIADVYIFDLGHNFWAPIAIGINTDDTHVIFDYMFWSDATSTNMLGDAAGDTLCG